MLRAPCDLPQTIEHRSHRVAERAARALIGRHEPFLELGGGRDALCGGEPRAAEDELCDVLERTSARVVELDRVDEPPVDCYVCFL